MSIEYGEASLLSAIEAALHEWRVMPRWKMLQIQQVSCAEFIQQKVGPDRITREQIEKLLKASGEFK